MSLYNTNLRRPALCYSLEIMGLQLLGGLSGHRLRSLLQPVVGHNHPASQTPFALVKHRKLAGCEPMRPPLDFHLEPRLRARPRNGLAHVERRPVPQLHAHAVAAAAASAVSRLLEPLARQRPVGRAAGADPGEGGHVEGVARLVDRAVVGADVHDVFRGVFAHDVPGTVRQAKAFALAESVEPKPAMTAHLDARFKLDHATRVFPEMVLEKLVKLEFA
mmetsp:Transcript_24960/g.62412  ORF Transcript_24960/g.62412 Transcript_24960/m.62412 type:complete len:219 (+) Transcript_24960:2014-2670(+)